MSEAAQPKADTHQPFTTKFQTLLDVEREYIEDRRRANGLGDLDPGEGLWGLSLSGGGVRSATFSLGVLQALTRCGWMTRFDYMSTVSGGGYIGCCLSSLLTGRTDTGLEDWRSPFTGLNVQEGYEAPDKTRLSVRHQIHHLRTHGEYLVPRSHLFSRDVQRAFGSVLVGMGHTILLFILVLVAFVALVHVALGVIEPDLRTLAPGTRLNIPGSETMGTFEYVKSVLSEWTSERIASPIQKIFSSAGDHLWLMLALGALGAVWCWAWLTYATCIARRFRPTRKWPGAETRAGWNLEDELESRFVRRLNTSSLLLGLVVTLVVSTYLRMVEGAPHFLAGLLVALALAAGGMITGYLLTHLLESGYARRSWRKRITCRKNHCRQLLIRLARGIRTRCATGRKNLLGRVFLTLTGLFPKPRTRSEESRFRRSLYGSLRGACLYGVLASLALPFLLVLLFSLSHLPVKFFWALAALAWAHFMTRKMGDASAGQLGGWMRRPLANLAVLLFLALSFSLVSALLLSLYREHGQFDIWLWGLIALACALLPLLVLGTYVNANRVAPHYFYRDRLTEAYLKTDARTVRPRVTKQGMPLTVLRDDEDLRLSELGKDNNRGPYHLMVAALNLTGSRELNRKSFLSDHFIFSRDYIGSRVTGWVNTRTYKAGTTRLARAMTISAAAVGSAMGQHTFGAQAFVTTLFNARLGYWMENPWNYRDGSPVRPRHRRTFWPMYLFREVFGLTSARKRLVNVSDGGHTGDNLGLLPLLRRRCATVVVCDAEADGTHSFVSFNNAVRMALIEENIGVDIDLMPIMTRTDTAAGYEASPTGVVVGRIHYPYLDSTHPAFEGRLVYVKATVTFGAIPVHVANYAKEHKSFPHDTTADQFFDDAQFEAYRALGEQLGECAADRL